MQDLIDTIEAAFEARAEITPANVSATVRDAVEQALALLDAGTARVAEPTASGWQVNEWLKKAVLLSFRIADNAVIDGGYGRFFDKVPTKFADFGAADFAAQGARVVPPATVRRGAYIAPGVVLMPSYVNIGAYVDSGTHGRHLGHGRLLRADRQERAPVRRRRHRRRAGAAAGGADHHRGRLLHRRPFGSGRRRGRGARRGAVDGRVHRPEHQDLQPRNRRDHATAACRPVPWWCRATCRPPTAATACTAP